MCKDFLFTDTKGSPGHEHLNQQKLYFLVFIHVQNNVDRYKAVVFLCARPRASTLRRRGELRVGEAEAAEHALVHRLQQVLVRRRQVRLLHREVRVEVTHVARALLQW